jgi:hypothetical protein
MTPAEIAALVFLVLGYVFVVYPLAERVLAWMENEKRGGD